MFYFFLQITDEEKSVRAVRESLPQEMRALSEELSHAKTKEDTEVINAKINKLHAKATREVLNSICGDKEILDLLLAHSPNIKSTEDIVKYSRIDHIIRATEDPAWLILDNDNYKWISDMINHQAYNQMVNDQHNNPIPMFPSKLKILIGTFLDRFKSAKDVMPEELLPKIPKKKG